jgi:hypothetical protein
VAAAAVPAAVLNALKARYPRAVIDVAEKLARDGVVQYELHLKKAPKKEIVRSVVPVEGPANVPEQGIQAAWRMVDAGYLRTMRIPLRRGRLFEESDSKVRPIVLSEGLARRLARRRRPHRPACEIRRWAGINGCRNCRRRADDKPQRRAAASDVLHAFTLFAPMRVCLRGDARRLRSRKSRSRHTYSLLPGDPSHRAVRRTRRLSRTWLNPLSCR